MVDFRYHIVSIVAVFLALAIGIVLGAGPLKTSSDVQLKAQVSDLRTAQSALQGSLDQTRGQVQFLDRFGAEVAPSLLGGRLAGLDVAVVALPGADPSTVAGVLAVLRQASATVSVQARLTGSWTDPGRRASLTAALDAGSATPAPRPTPPEVSAAPTGSSAPATPSGASAPATPTPPATPSTAATVHADAARELATAILTSARSALPTVAGPTSPSPSATRPGPTATARATATGGPTVRVTGPTPIGHPTAPGNPTAPGRPTVTGRPSPPGRPTGAPGRLGRRGRPASSPRTTTAVQVSTAPGRPRPIVPVRRVRPDPGAVAARTLTALVDGGFVQLAGPVPRVHPTLAVVVAADPPRPVDDGTRAAVAELASLADALRAGSDGTVVTGDAAAAGDGGLLALVRATRPAAGGLSTVDSVDTPAGRIAVPLALVQQQSGGRVGQYGSVGSTDGPLPQLPGIGPG